ncbi:glycosyltransferase family 2 protein [Croceicoccus marinus]|uniref:Glycosyltransferase family 2 protein n=1 Tax=Croceicoccus marinus TaxID=450378 RepID=A0A7G6VT17_9SPHN|nr:glycosyltransferase family 2 protein [Croceicoccus marinus]QNE04882.1 glycosyltransferase family 2 protein [Croceicoccus marinus]
MTIAITSAAGKPLVTICICTFRRESIRTTLHSIAERANAKDVAEVLIIDNEITDNSGRILKAADDAGISVRYVHAPACNISIARNAGLAQCSTRWLAFIDDDETAEDGWLDYLLEHTGVANAIIGQSMAIYGGELPDWTRNCDFHSNRISGRTDNAYTSNALIDMDFVKKHNLAFDLSLGKSGGEDTLFFRQMSQMGGAFVYEPRSVVSEAVSPSRATMSWVLKRRFRYGQVHALVSRITGETGSLRLAFSAAVKLGFCSAMVALTAWNPDQARQWLARGTMHAGVVAFLVKPQMLQEYEIVQAPAG